MMRVANLLSSYWRTRHLHFDSREALERHQRRKLHAFAERRLAKSPYFAHCCHTPFEAWPTMTKAEMMTHFDRMNTARLTLDEVLSCALRAERSRDFAPTVRGYSVGLSSGTSGTRGVFVVSQTEQAIWAGAILARLLPQGLFAGERVALFLRANNNLYTAVRNPCLSFEFFDLLEPIEAQYVRLEHYAPTIIVGPAQVLRALAQAKRANRVAIKPRKVISGAEVLEPFDRDFLAQTFGSVGEIYQATEGFLGATCAHGTLHLNEAYVLVEPQWLDARRFVPVVTDFTRYTQPIIRYRLDDILVKRAEPCTCGSHEMALERIEGRCDDLLRLPDERGAVVDVFADGLSRALAQVLPLDADYRVIQRGVRHLELYVDASAGQLAACRAHLDAYLSRLGVAVSRLDWMLQASLPPADFGSKRRRIIRCEEEK
jgi:putative adenylate-forming enzyme